MHVSTKRVAFLGLMLAITVLCTILSSVIETGTLFFLAAGSYLVGVSVLETTIGYGIAFYLASVLLSLILAPNKIYCLTFAAMAAYLLIMEIITSSLVQRNLKKLATLEHNEISIKPRKKLLWTIKLVVFNVGYLPILIFAPKLIYPGELEVWMYIGFFLGGQIALVLYDFAYEEFMVKYWKKIRKYMQ